MFNLLIMPLAALFQGGIPQDDQGEPERKVRIEIITTENGETKRVTKELDSATEAEIEATLKELGMLEHFNLSTTDENVTIDIRRFDRDGNNDDIALSLAPLPPLPPLPPGKPSCSYAFLGVNTETVTDGLRKEKKLSPKEGAYITSVVHDTPAEKAGLQEGDVITAVDGKPVADSDALTDAIRDHQPGEKAKLTYYRSGAKHTTDVELAERRNKVAIYNFDHGDQDWDWDAYFGDQPPTPPTPRAFLGVTPGEEDDATNGALIGSVEEGSAAEQMGIREGDVVTSVDGVAVADFGALSKAIKAHQPGEEVTIGLRRDGKDETLKGTLGTAQVWSWGGTMDAPSWEEFHGIEGLSEEDRADLEADLQDLRVEMQDLRRELEEEFGPRLRKETRITIQRMPLSDDEKAVLSKKGVADLDKTLDLGDMRCFPNPSNGFYRLQFDVAERGDLHVDVHDATGESVYQERITGFKGRYERTLDLSDKAAGTYFLVISQNGRTSTQKLLKQ